MKKIIIFLVCVTICAFSAETVLAPDHLAHHFPHVFKTPAFSLHDDIIQIKGQPQLGEQKNSQQKLICHLKALDGQNLEGATLLLEFEGKILRNSGKVEICIRTVDDQGKSTGYPGLYFRSITKVTEWKKFSKKIKLPTGTKTCYFFIWARYLEADDDVQIRKVTISKL